MTQKNYNSPTLDNIRQRIDNLDSRIHDCLMERAELVLKIGEEKKKNNLQVVQPAREARMIRRLLERHKGLLPDKAVVRIWRELVGAVSLLQTDLKVAVAVEEGNHGLWELARDYFGSSIPFRKADSALTALAAVREGRAYFAVLPWPEDDDNNPWWLQLGNESEDQIRIMVHLPHCDDPDHKPGDHKGLIVAKAGFDSSDEDHSFLFIACDSTISRGKLVENAKTAGLSPVGLASCKSINDTPSRHLLEVESYIPENDARLEELANLLGEEAQVVLSGGYPVPPSYCS